MTLLGRRVYYPPMCGFRRPWRWVPLVLFVLCAGYVGHAQKHARKRVERTQIVVLEDQWRKAQLAGDVPSMDHLLSDDFLGVTAAGEVVTKSQQLDRMRTHELDIRRLDISDTKIKISGNLAVVTSLAQLDGTTDGHPLVGAFRYTRVYQHQQGDGWKITSFEATRVRKQAGVPGSDASSPPAGAAEHLASEPSSLRASPEVSVSRPPRS